MIFTAEIGLNHDGTFDLIFEMIRRAKQAGADIAKFQLGWRNGIDEINHFNADRTRQVMEWCDYHGIEFMASIISDEAWEYAHALGSRRYKIAARTVKDNPALVDKVLSQGKETFISLGMWEGEGWPFGPPSEKLRYIFCRSRYPSYPSDMRGFPARFDADGFYGYSDHMHGTEGCLLALARGARYIEKHFTLNRTSKVIRDHILSATPDEFHRLTELGRPLASLVEVIDG
jgi:sialic acid synthase SpsE